MMGCDLHNPRTTGKVQSDWNANGETIDAYLYRETDTNFYEIMSHSKNKGKGMVMDYSKNTATNKEIAHGFDNTNILFNDGHVKNAKNTAKIGENFTVDAGVPTLDIIWENTDKKL